MSPRILKFCVKTFQELQWNSVFTINMKKANPFVWDEWWWTLVDSFFMLGVRLLDKIKTCPWCVTKLLFNEWNIFSNLQYLKRFDVHRQQIYFKVHSIVYFVQSKNSIVWLSTKWHEDIIEMKFVSLFLCLKCWRKNRKISLISILNLSGN